jgi:hypothetical protein
MRSRLIIGLAGLAALAAPGGAAPQPCGGIAQISDPLLDGHHPNTDVAAAWFSEDAGRLQAVIRPNQAVWEPAHDDSEAAGFAMLYSVGGQIGYVRAEAPRAAPVRFDYGTWTAAGGFASAGATTGETSIGPGGAVTIDVPAATGAVPGAALVRPFVLTYDGGDTTGPHWVDRAPGGVTPAGTEFGADYVVGGCPAPGAPIDPTAPVVVTGVALSAPALRVGGGQTRVTGRIVPARGGVPVSLRLSAKRTILRRATTRADGTFTALVPIGETTRIRATAGGLGSQTRTVRVRATVRIALRRNADGSATVIGQTRPGLPGRVLWLGATAVTPSAVVNARGGGFTIRLRRPVPGRFQALFIPAANRAERGVSNTVVIR